MALPDGLQKYLDQRFFGHYSIVSGTAAQLTGSTDMQQISELERVCAASQYSLQLVNGVLVAAPRSGSPNVSGGGAQILADVSLSSPGSQFSASGLDFSAWLLVRIIARVRANQAGEGAGAWVRTMMRFNDDNAANYVWETSTPGSAQSNQSGGYINGIQGLWGSGTNFSSNYFGENFYELVSPGSSSAYKSVNFQGGIPQGSAEQAGFGGGIWKSTSPITKVTLLSNDGSNLDTGSRMIILGLA